MLDSPIIRRFLAYIVDVVLLFFILAPLGFIIQIAGEINIVDNKALYLTLLLNFTLPVLFYFVISDYVFKGITIGKRLFNLQAFSKSGGSISIQSAFLRNIIKLLPWELVHLSLFLFMPATGGIGGWNFAGLGLAYLLIFVYSGFVWRTEGKQSIHDFVAQTMVTNQVAEVEKTTPA